MRTWSLAAQAFLLLGLGSAAPAALAQVDAAAGEAGNQDILVTARRREERLQDVPVAITAITGESLARQGVTDVTQLRSIAPSLQIAPSSFGPTVPGYTIRGQRLIEQLLSQDPSVGVYVADVVQQRPHGTNQSLFDIESVQVLKGPQGTLFGRNTTGGAILIEPRRPVLGSFEGYVTAEAGNYDMFGANGAINLPIGETAALRVAGQVRYHDGYGFNLTTGRETYDQNMESFRASFLWEPSDGVSSYTLGTYFNYKDQGAGTALGTLAPGSNAAVFFPAMVDAFARQAARDPLIVENNAALFNRTRTWSISNTTSFEIADGMTIKNIIGYRRVKNDFGGDFDGGPATVFDSANILRARQFSEELQLLGKTLDDRLQYIVGGYFFRESGTDTQPSRVLSPRLSNRDGYAVNKSYSVFAQADFRVTDGLTLTAGARQTWDKRFLDVRSRTSTGTPPNPVDLSFCRIQVSDTDPTPRDPCSLPLRAKFDSFTYLLTAAQKINDDVLVYITHNTGYRAGGLNLRASKPGEGIPYRPEKVKNYEIGLKSTFMDGMITFNAAGFYSDYTDIQRSISRNCPGSTSICTGIENAASARIKGLELEAAIRPTEWLTVGGFLGHVDAKYRRFVTSAGLDLSRNIFAFVPKTTYGLNAEARVPVGPASHASFAINYFHQSSQQTADINDDRPIPGYGLLNASIGLENAFGQPFDIRAYMNNITDERYATGGTDLVASIGTNSYYIGEPRTYGVSATYRF